MAGVNFMESPLVIWVQTFNTPDLKLVYEDLADGTFLNNIMHQIDPRPKQEHINMTVEDAKERLHNWDVLLRNIRIYYEDCLQQFIVMKLPNVLSIGRDPNSDQAQEEISKTLLLLLGCAVQCERKEEFIENIKSLDIDVQHEMVNLIQEITDDSKSVCAMDIVDGVEPEHAKILGHHVRNLLQERDSMVEEIRDLTQNLDMYQSQLEAAQKSAGAIPSGSPMAQEKHHLGVELADCKAKMRRIRQELEEKNELIQELKEELDENKTLLSKLRNENLTLSQDARAARTYRDELDVLKEKASRADKHETEILKYKEKLNELEFFKARVEELREDNTILLETKLMLEEQLLSSHKRVETVIELENEIMRYKQQSEETAAARDADRERIQALVEETARLEFEMKSSMNESANLEHELTKAMKDSGQGKGNSISDQLSETANAKILRLELENQRLQKLVDEARESSVLESNSRQLELEKENHRLAKKVEKLQDAASKETEKFIELEQCSEEMAREKDHLKQTIETIKESAERQVKELETENAQLMHTVEILRERNEKTQDIKLRDTEKENKRLHEAVKELRGNLSTLEFDNRQLRKTHDRLKEDVTKVSDLEKESEKLEKENSDLHKTIATLKLTCDKYEQLEQEASDLEVENKKLSKTVESLRNSVVKMEQLEQENIALNVENQRLHRVIENMKNSSSRVLDLEQENNEQNKEIQQLKKTLEAQKLDIMKYDQLEIDLLDVDSDNQKLSKSLELANKKIEQLQRDNLELENENQKLGKTIETLKVSLRKLEDLEKDNTDLEQENNALHKEQSVLEKEVKRLRHSLEVKDTTIDEYSSKISALERETRNFRKTMDKNFDLGNRYKEMEKENREMFQQSAMDKKTLASLREDLVNEKIKTQQLNNELDKLSQELEKIGLNKDKIIAAQSADSRLKSLEDMMEVAHKKSLDIKNEKIHTLESRLDESMSRNQKLSSEIKLLKRKCAGLKQTIDEDGMVSPDAPHPPTTLTMLQGDGKPSRVVTQVNLKTANAQEARNILTIQEHLVDVERTNATLMAENKILKTQTHSMEERIDKLENQNASLQSQISTANVQSSTLQSENARLQVESTTLFSQLSALKSQNGALKSQCSQIESDHEQLVTSHDELQNAHESLVSDHEALQKLHEQLTSEYEALISEHGSLKSVHKQLKADYKELKEKTNEFYREKENISIVRQAVEHDRQMIRNEAKSLGSLQSDYINVKDECIRLREVNNKLNSDYKDLLLEHKNVKTEYNNLQLRHTELQGDMAECKDQLNTMDVEVSKMANKVEALNQMNNQLEEENRALMLQLQALLTQNQELLTQTLDSKEQHHEEERAYLEKLADLRRQKEKLEEKIMEQYRRYDPSPKKSRSFGANLVRKARGFINRRNKKEGLSSPEHSIDSPDNSSLGSYNDSMDGKKNSRLGKQGRSKSMGQLFSITKVAETPVNSPRKFSQPVVSKSTEGLDGSKLTKSKHLASSTTGINLLSSAKDEPAEGGFSIRVHDLSKDRNSTSTDSSDLHLPLRKLIPGSMSIYDRTPEDSPRDGKSGLMSLAEFLEDLNNSPETRRKLMLKKKAKEKEEKEKAELEMSVNSSVSDSSKHLSGDDASRTSNQSQATDTPPERRFTSYGQIRGSPREMPNDYPDHSYSQVMASQSAMNLSHISKDSNIPSVNHSHGSDRPVSAMGSPMDRKTSTPTSSGVQGYERPRSAMGHRVMPDVPQRPAREGNYSADRQRPVSEYRPREEYPSRSEEVPPSGIQLVRQPGGRRQLPQSPSKSGINQNNMDSIKPPSPSRSDIPRKSSLESKILSDRPERDTYVSVGRHPERGRSSTFDDAYSGPKNLYSTVDCRSANNSEPGAVSSWGHQNPAGVNCNSYPSRHNDRPSDNCIPRDPASAKTVKSYQDNVNQNLPVAPPRRRNGSNPNLLEDVPLHQPTPVRPGNRGPMRATEHYGPQSQSQQRAVHPVKPYSVTMNRPNSAGTVRPTTPKLDSHKNQPYTDYTDSDPPPRPPPPQDGQQPTKQSVWYEYGCV